jgi:hypothetical protein
MSDKYAVVITTINHPTRAVVEIARTRRSSTPSSSSSGTARARPTSTAGATYLDLEQQRSSGFRYGAERAAKHYARKNVGYLLAIRNGATS